MAVFPVHISVQTPRNHYDKCVKHSIPKQERIQARELWQHNPRLDLGIKLNYAKSLLSTGKEDVVSLEDYVLSIGAINGFCEDKPMKNSPRDFLTTFNSLTWSMKNRGYLSSEEAIQVNEDYRIITGAHRLSIATLLDIPIKIELKKAEHEDFDKSFLSSRSLSSAVLGRACLGMIENRPRTRVIIVFPIAKLYGAEIEKLIRSELKVMYEEEIKIDFSTSFHLKKISYHLHSGSNDLNSWIGSEFDDYSGIRSHVLASGIQGIAKIYVFDETSPSKVREVKERIRRLMNIGNYSVHSTDSYAETLDVLRICLNPISLEIVRSERNSAVKDLEVKLQTLNIFISQQGLNKDEFVISGSAPLAAKGLRKIRDLDIILDKGNFNSKYSIPNGIALSTETHYRKNFSELTYHPSNYFWYYGFKFVNLEETLAMKRRRNEFPKDYEDVALIEKEKERRGTNHRVKYWKIKTQILVFKFNRKKSLVKQKLYLTLNRLGIYVIIRKMMPKKRIEGELD